MSCPTTYHHHYQTTATLSYRQPAIAKAIKKKKKIVKIKLSVVIPCYSSASCHTMRHVSFIVVCFVPGELLREVFTVKQYI